MAYITARAVIPAPPNTIFTVAPIPDLPRRLEDCTIHFAVTGITIGEGGRSIELRLQIDSDDLDMHFIGKEVPCE